MKLTGQDVAIALSVVANLTSLGAILYTRHCRKKIDALITKLHTQEAV